MENIDLIYPKTTLRMIPPLALTAVSRIGYRRHTHGFFEHSAEIILVRKANPSSHLAHLHGGIQNQHLGMVDPDVSQVLKNRLSHDLLNVRFI